MKKIILSMALAMIVASAFGQKANVSKAQSNAKSGNYSAAREFIAPALTDPETSNSAETWYVAGFIGEKENDALWLKAKQKLDYDSKAKGKAMMESINYYLKADELGQIPNEKGKVNNKYRKDITNAIKNYYLNSDNLFTYFAELYDDKANKDAYDVSQIYFSIPNLPLMTEQGIQLEKDTVYYTIQYYAGLAASKAGMHDEAIDLFQKSIANNFEKVSCYQLISAEYQTQKDTVNYVQTLKDGFRNFPKEPWFLQNLINYYVFTDQDSQALSYLDDAISNDPEVAEYYFVRGNLYSRLNNYDQAEFNYNKALEINPDFAGAYAGKGYLLYNQASKIIDDAGQIRDNTQYQAEMDKANNMFQQCLPLLEKAAQLNDKELEYLENLKQVYYRLNMTDKYTEITNKINALKGQ